MHGKLTLSLSSYIVKCWQKICPKNEKLYIFESPRPCHFKYAKKFAKFFLTNLIFNQEKLKKYKFPLTGFLQKICNFFSQNLCNPFPNVIGFPKS